MSDTSLKVGAKVTINGKPALGMGTIRFLGEPQFSTGLWVGVELDIPGGKNDGMVQDVRYFTCPANHGLFVKDVQVTVVQPAESESDKSSVDKTPDKSQTKVVKPPSTKTTTGPSTPRDKPEVTPSPTSKQVKPETTDKTPKTTTEKTADKPTEKTSTKVEKPAAVDKPITEKPDKPSEKTQTPTKATETPKKTDKPSEKTPADKPPEKTPTKVEKPAAVDKPNTEKLDKSSEKTQTPTKTDKAGEKTTDKPADKPDKPTGSKLDKIKPKPETTPKATTEKTTADKPTEKTPTTKVEKPAAADKPDKDQSSDKLVDKSHSSKKLSDSTSGKSSEPAAVTEPATTDALKTPKSIKQPSQPTSPEQKEEEPSTPTSTTVSAPAARNENIDKLMRTLKELNDFKSKAQETIRGLQLRLKELTVENEKLTSERQVEREGTEKEKEKAKKESEKELTKLQRDWEKQKSELEEQITSLTENLEMVTLDREIAEEKAETLEKELEQLKGKMDVLELGGNKTTRSEATVSEDKEKISDEDYLLLMDQNEKLKEALLKLRDLSLEEKQEKEKRIKELERENKTIPNLQDKIGKLEAELTSAKDTLEELTEALDASAEAEQMVEQLTEKNLNLEEKMKELEVTIAELEALRDISQQLEENQNAVEKQLRSEIYAKEIEILDQASSITNLKNSLSEKDRIMEQFRAVVRSLQEQLAQLKQKEEVTQSQANELSSQSQELMSLNLQLQSKVLKATAIAIDQEIATLNLAQAETQFAFIKDYLPKNAFQADSDSLSFNLLIKRFIFKSELIAKHLGRYQMTQENTPDLFSSKELSFFWELKHTLQNISHISRDFEYTLEHCDVDAYLKLGTLYYELSPSEKRLDFLLSLLRDEELSLTYPSDEMKHFQTHLQHLSATYTDPTVLPLSRSLQHEIQNIAFKCNSMLLQERSLHTTVTQKLHNTSSTVVVNVVMNSDQTLFTIPSMKKIRHCTELARKLTSTLNEYQPQDSAVALLKEKLNGMQDAASIGASRLMEFSTAFTKILSDVSALDAGKMRELIAAQYNDKFDAEWRWLDTLASGIYDGFTEMINLMLTGLPIASDKGKRQTPYQQRAESVKSLLSDSVVMKDKIEEKQHEIIDLKKQLQLKANELQDALWKEQNLEKRLEKLQKAEEKLNAKIAEDAAKRQDQEKMYTEALDTIQKDADHLTQENRALKEKIAKIEASKPSVKVETAQPSVPTEITTVEITALRGTIQYLKQEIIRLRGARTSQIVSGLPPLISSITSSAPPMDDSTPAAELMRCNKELLQLSREIQLKSASPKVVDVTLSSLSALDQLTIQKSEMELLQKRAHSLRHKIQSLAAQVQPTSDQQAFATFPSTFATKILQDQHAVPLGRISMPVSVGGAAGGPVVGSRVTKVLVDYPSFHSIHNIFANQQHL